MDNTKLQAALRFPNSRVRAEYLRILNGYSKPEYPELTRFEADKLAFRRARRVFARSRR
jgi:hypothetical protein